MAKTGLNGTIVNPVGNGKVPAIAANTFVKDVKLTQPQQIKFDGSSRVFPKR